MSGEKRSLAVFVEEANTLPDEDRRKARKGLTIQGWHPAGVDGSVAESTLDTMWRYVDGRTKKGTQIGKATFDAEGGLLGWEIYDEYATTDYPEKKDGE